MAKRGAAAAAGATAGSVGSGMGSGVVAGSADRNVVTGRALISTPGSFISDLFFYDELVREAGSETAQSWFQIQMNARSICTTLTPGTPCKSPHSSAPTSPRSRPQSIDWMDCHELIQDSSEWAQSLERRRDGSHYTGVFCKSQSEPHIPVRAPFMGSIKSYSESHIPVRGSTSGFTRKTDRSKPWRPWKTYSDGLHPQNPSTAICLGDSPLAEHEESHQSDSEPEEIEVAEAAHSECPSQEASDRTTPGSGCRKGSVDLSGKPKSSMDLSVSMRDLELLVSNEIRETSARGLCASNMALLFTDAAHTVLNDHE